LLSPNSTRATLRGKRKTVAASVVNDRIATAVVLRQLFNLVFRGFWGFNGLNPIRSIFPKPENIKPIFHFLTILESEAGQGLDV
jgi:hypothetical protein